MKNELPLFLFFLYFVLLLGRGLSSHSLLLLSSVVPTRHLISCGQVQPISRETGTSTRAVGAGVGGSRMCRGTGVACWWWCPATSRWHLNIPSMSLRGISILYLNGHHCFQNNRPLHSGVHGVLPILTISSRKLGNGSRPRPSRKFRAGWSRRGACY